jgi:glyoxylase-like metal-dependent hydrolase (beta-lactamase superfamily II)
VIRLAATMRISNVWLLETAGGRYLVDSGFSLERPLLRRQLWQWGVRAKGDLAAVILTHRHSDHAANAAWLRRTYDAPIVCHEADARVLMGKEPAPKICGLAGQHLHERMLCYIEDHAPSHVHVDEALSEGRWRDDFRILHVPGHTDGSIMILHRPSGTLFSGDAIIAGLAPFRAFEWLDLAKPGFSTRVHESHDRTRAAISALDAEVRTLCSGHGPIVDEQVTRKLQKLIARPNRH